jgi:squalene-hopene/tetraprenyl-beta-curcumene cyclase
MTVESQAPAALAGAALQPLDQAIERAARCLLRLQSREGYWAGELEADTTLESDYILFHLWMDPPEAGKPWRPRAWNKIVEAARYILERQSASGGWQIYPGGPDNLSASVKAYFALKAAGHSPAASHMQAARKRILDLGGLENANSYTRIYLTFFGLYDRDRIPTIPPELILLGPQAYINIYEMSSWTRAIVVPLSILCALQPRRPVPGGWTLDELRTGAPEPERAGIFWKIDRLLKLWERSGWTPRRAEAIRACERWMLERFEGSDGLGAIFPSMLNSILALNQLGYQPDHPVLQRAIRQFEALVIREDGMLRVQPCYSPVWDTAIAAYALASAGYGEEPAVGAAVRWLLSKEVRRKGDWAVKNPGVEPGGWYFEFANEFYPDIDDTAMVLLPLAQAPGPEPEAQRAAVRRAVDWVVSMQGKDGGWAAFDKDNDRQILNRAPFADHNAMLDPACADITGRVLEAMGALGLRDHPAVARGVEYLRRTQEPDGSWPGRWGVNYIYGTCFALRGLRAAGVSPREARIIQAGEWIRSYQNPDGGWGESCASYDDPSLKGTGPSTASQTAWALLALFAADDCTSASVQRGVEYLLRTQTREGRWEEPWFTGTGFPRVFYLKYHLYSLYFPLIALAEYRSRRPVKTTL